MKKNQGKALPEVCGPFRGLLTQICWYVVRTFGLRQIDSEIVKEKSEKAFPKVCGNLAFRGLFSGRNDRKKIILGWSGQKVKSRKEFIISQYKSVLVQVLIPAMGVISSDLLSPR